jgi:hypothetical protein
MGVTMGTATRQANFLLPEDLLEDLKKFVSSRQQSKFVAEALRKELKRLRLQKAFETSFGGWEEEEHPELRHGADAFVRKARKSTRLKSAK